MLPSETNVVNEVSGISILLGDLVQAEVTVNIVGDDEVPLSEVCHVNVVISSVFDVVVGGDVIDAVLNPRCTFFLMLLMRTLMMTAQIVSLNVDKVVMMSVLLLLLLLVTLLVLLLVKLLK